MTISSHAPAPVCAEPHVCVLVEQRYLDQDQPAGVVAALESRGIPVHTLVAETVSVDLSGATWTAGVSVALARGRSTAVLGMLRSLESCGTPVVDSAAAVQAVVDKAGMAAAMAAAGVPTPTTWLGSPADLARRDDLRFPLVLKPVTGDNARGLVVVRSRRELANVVWPEAVALAQDFHRGDGHDLKLYVAGDVVWAVRRPSPIESDGSPRASRDPGVPVPVTPALRDIAHRCSRVFGLRLFGVDCVVGPGGRALAVEVNDFPNYRGLPGAANEVLADLVLAVRVAPPVLVSA